MIPAIINATGYPLRPISVVNLLYLRLSHILPKQLVRVEFHKEDPLKSELYSPCRIYHFCSIAIKCWLNELLLKTLFELEIHKRCEMAHPARRVYDSLQSARPNSLGALSRTDVKSSRLKMINKLVWNTVRGIYRIEKALLNWYQEKPIKSALRLWSKIWWGSIRISNRGVFNKI